MNQIVFRNYHERVAARLRSLAATATTAALKTQLMEKAEKHEQLAEEVQELRAAAEAEALRKETARLPGHKRLVRSKSFVLLSLFQKPRFDRSPCRILSQCAQMSRLPLMVVGHVPRERSKAVIVDHRISLRIALNEATDYALGRSPLWLIALSFFDCARRASVRFFLATFIDTDDPNRSCCAPAR